MRKLFLALLCIALFAVILSFVATGTLTASGNALPNGDFERGFLFWTQRPEWRIIPLDGHGAGITRTRGQRASLCADLTPVTAPVTLSLLYFTRGKGALVLSLHSDHHRLAARVLPRSPAPRPLTWSPVLVPGIRPTRLCLTTLARGHFTAGVDDLAVNPLLPRR